MLFMPASMALMITPEPDIIDVRTRDEVAFRLYYKNFLDGR